MFLRRDVVGLYCLFRRFVSPLLDFVCGIDQCFFCYVVDTRYLVVPVSHFRLGGVCRTFRELFYSSEGGGQAQVDPRGEFRLTRCVGRIDAEAIRFVRVYGA